MLLGSPAGMANLALALKVRTRTREPPAHDVKEEMDATEDDAEEEKDED